MRSNLRRHKKIKHGKVEDIKGKEKCGVKSGSRWIRKRKKKKEENKEEKRTGGYLSRPMACKRKIHGVGLRCNQCDEKFKNERELEKHWRIEHETWCDRRDKQYDCLKMLRMHVRKEHGIVEEDGSEEKQRDEDEKVKE